jgi:hypothetical protein
MSHFFAWPRPAVALTTALATALAGLLPAQTATAADFTFAGVVDSGPLAGQAFSGVFGFDEAGVTPGLDGDLPLTSFALSLGGASFTLASADAPAWASFAGGTFVGLAYVDTDSPSAATALQVALVPGFAVLDEAYLAYETADALAGFGSYGVSPVPEPAAVALWLGGLAGLAWRWRSGTRRRA